MSPQGREYYTWPIVTDADPIPAIELSIDGGTTWHPTEAVSGGVRALIAGPDAEDNPPGTIVLPRGTTCFIGRAVDNPEVVIRDARSIRIDGR